MYEKSKPSINARSYEAITDPVTLLHIIEP